MAVWNTISYSEIHPDRFDAEYHSKLFKENINLLESLGNTVTIGQLFKLIKRGDQPQYDVNGTVKVLRSVNVGFMTFNDTRQEYVTVGFLNKSSKGQVRQDDILITSTGVGTLGRTSIWNSNEDAYCDGHITILRNTEANPYFITVFLNTEYGLLQFNQNYRGSSGQIEIYPYDLSKIVIPKFLFDYQDEIGNTLVEAFSLEKQSKCFYQQAEAILAQELQLYKLKLPNKNWYTADYCEVVNERRINAEFFSPDVYYILSQDFLKEGATINDVFEIIRGYTPKCYYQSGVPVVKTKNVRTPKIDNKRISDYANFQEPLIQTKENDLILAAVGIGSLGRISYVTDDNANCAIDSTLRILRKKDLSLNDMEIPTMLFLSTEVGQKLIYRGISGTTGIISLPDDYLERIPIPVLEESVRRNVTELVLNSIKAKNHSEQLLAQAKHRVEELIEQEANKHK